ncbi:mobilization protein [Streptomyces sp. NPDC050085]|uniref:mobilization protein n=1 Tax=Streptomyces sp. NPDC050085 TaxID=3365600 RepID=UPI0037B0AD27
MVPKIHNKGSDTHKLLQYLYRTGRGEAHVDPHLVAAWDEGAPDPGRDREATLRQLQRLLDQPVMALDADERPAQHVWHLSVRNAASDRLLSDAEWGEVARRMLAAVGIDDPAQGAGCRWAAVRHADDHIHIVATLVREDGRKPGLSFERRRVQAEARALEVAWGLQRLNTGDGTAARRPSSAEQHKARRQGRARAAREELREVVRLAVAGAADPEEFFARLDAAGVLVRRRYAPSGDLLGYNVALSGDVNKAGKPVYYSGSKLAPDLSWPKINARFEAPLDGPGPLQGDDRGRAGRTRPARRTASARGRAADRLWEFTFTLHRDEEGTAAARIAATAEILDALAATSADETHRELRSAAWAFERASRSHVRAAHRHARGLRRAARDLVQAGTARHSGPDGAMTALVLDVLWFAVIASAHWHARRGHIQQAAAADEAARHLRAAYQLAAATPLGILRERGRRLMPAQLHQQAQLLRTALPQWAHAVLAEPGWPALAATLAEAEQAGHNTRRLLARVAAARELDTADSVSDVLVWRLRRLARLPQDPAAKTTSPGRPRAVAQDNSRSRQSR